MNKKPLNENKPLTEDEEFVDVNACDGIELKPRAKKNTVESYGLEYRKTTVCKHCKEEVDVNAEVCPHCGHYADSGKKRYVPISEKKAWSIKIFLGVIVLMIFLFIVATK